MAADRELPQFLFDVAGWRGSRAVQRMSFAERGVFFEMLLEQWEKRNLPDGAEAVADLIASSDAQVAEVVAAWPVVRRKFVTSRGDETRIYNETMERTRRKQREYRRRRQEAGSVGGRAKAAKHRQDSDLLSSNAKQVLSNAVAMLSGKGKEVKVSEEKRRETGGASAVLFARFWDAYPRKVAKQVAWKAWQKIRPDESLLAAMLQALEWQIRLPDWTKEGGAYIPHPASYLNAGRWQDERPTVKTQASYQPAIHDGYDGWKDRCRTDHGDTCGNYEAHRIRVFRDAQERASA